KGKVKADFVFPENHVPKKFDTYDPEIKNLSCEQLLASMKKSNDFVKPKTTGQLNSMSGFGESKTKIINSNGLNVELDYSNYYADQSIMYPGSYAGINTLLLANNYRDIPEEKMTKMIELYTKGLKEVSVEPCALQVMFSPSTLYSLLWRLRSGANAQSIHEDTSPIKNKTGEQIFSEKLTVIDNPHSAVNPAARGFDDEGVPTSKFTVIENGVLKNFYNNLDYAAKLNVKPTGHGYKNAMWGGDTVSIAPAPTLANLTIVPGDDSFDDMIRKIKRGILVVGVLGAHSGNIPNGDFSIGINPGLYIENGEIVGRVKDGMIAGNIYDVMKRVTSIEDKVHITHSGIFPAIAFEDVKFS
ncbi:TldD/PmbA family protein, partial [bacterium]|nr:TldD/PmbA family protein [bacterium]